MFFYRKGLSTSGLEVHSRDQWNDKKNPTNPKESKERRKRETKNRWDT